jgi:hypothetical protein
MQALKSLFRRTQVQAAAAAQRSLPVELSPQSLKLVGGGLPRVSGEAAMKTVTSSIVIEGDKLPRVS